MLKHRVCLRQVPQSMNKYQSKHALIHTHQPNNQFANHSHRYMIEILTVWCKALYTQSIRNVKENNPQCSNFRLYSFSNMG